MNKKSTTYIHIIFVSLLCYGIYSQASASSCISFYSLKSKTSAVVEVKSNTTIEPNDTMDKRLNLARRLVVSALRSTGDQTPIILNLLREMTKEIRDQAINNSVQASVIIAKTVEVGKTNSIDQVNAILNERSALRARPVGRLEKLTSSRAKSEAEFTRKLGQLANKVTTEKSEKQSILDELLIVRENIKKSIQDLTGELVFLKRVSETVLEIENIEQSDSLEVHLIINGIVRDIGILASQKLQLENQLDTVDLSIRSHSDRIASSERFLQVTWPPEMVLLKSTTSLLPAPPNHALVTAPQHRWFSVPFKKPARVRKVDQYVRTLNANLFVSQNPEHIELQVIEKRKYKEIKPKEYLVKGKIALLTSNEDLISSILRLPQQFEGYFVSRGGGQPIMLAKDLAERMTESILKLNEFVIAEDLRQDSEAKLKLFLAVDSFKVYLKNVKDHFDKNNFSVVAAESNLSSSVENIREANERWLSDCSEKLHQFWMRQNGIARDELMDRSQKNRSKVENLSELRLYADLWANPELKAILERNYPSGYERTFALVSWAYTHSVTANDLFYYSQNLGRLKDPLVSFIDLKKNFQKRDYAHILDADLASFPSSIMASQTLVMTILWSRFLSVTSGAPVFIGNAERNSLVESIIKFQETYIGEKTVLEPIHNYFRLWREQIDGYTRSE